MGARAKKGKTHIRKIKYKNAESDRSMEIHPSSLGVGVGGQPQSGRRTRAWRQLNVSVLLTQCNLGDNLKPVFIHRQLICYVFVKSHIHLDTWI